MDARKIQFLIAIQREIDKLEEQEGESARVERLKSRFYNVAPLIEFAQSLPQKDPTSSLKKVSNDSGQEATEGPVEVQAQGTSGSKQELFHYPRTAKERLSFFSTNDVYKQFTHHVSNDAFSFESLMESVNWHKDFAGEFNELNTASAYRLRYFMLTPVINEKKYYANNERGFWTYNYVIPIGWGSPEVEAWCRENPNRYPSAMPIPKEKQKPSKYESWVKYSTFGNVIQRFKHDIEQRTDDPAQTFDRLLRNSLAEVDLNRDLKPEMVDKDFKSVTFYADLVQLKKALHYIFTWILHEKRQSNRVRITLRDDDAEKKYELAIFHVGAYLYKPKQGQKIDGTGGDTSVVRAVLRSVCDWTAIYSFSDGTSLAFPYLTDGCNVREPVEGYDVLYEGGITHKLSFYK